MNGNHDGVARIDLSSSSAESTMDDDTSNGHRHQPQIQTQSLTKAHSLTTTDHNLPAHSFAEAEGENDGADDNLEVENSEMWNTFSDSFQQVQSVLDRNRVLIQQVNENQQSKMHDNLVQNVSLIQEINGNINKVVSLYSDLSVNFSNMCQERNATIQSEDQAGKPDG